MDLSSQQAQAVMHGVGPRNITIEPVELPPPNPLPEFVTGFSIRWHEHFDNAPEFVVEVNKAILDNNLLWEEKNGVYVGMHPSGFARMHVHHGKIMHDPVIGLCTTPEEGYGGRHFPLNMRDGRRITLRGPRHVGAGSAARAGFEPLLEIHTKQNGTTYFGDYVTLPTFSAIVAAFDPGRKFANVTEHNYATFQPLTRDGFAKCQLRTRDWKIRYGELA